jgi:hypothetical protein
VCSKNAHREISIKTGTIGIANTDAAKLCRVHKILERNEKDRKPSLTNARKYDILIPRCSISIPKIRSDLSGSYKTTAHPNC